MPSLPSFLRALGNDQAVANAARLLHAREQETWLVAGLVRRLDRLETQPGVTRATGDAPSRVAI